MKTVQTSVCKRCGEPTGPRELVVRNSLADPLQVSECGHCGAIVDIGGHLW
ncbi:hypothetical protein [Haloferax sp. DFSO52]|uniref:hypothetical protein n=1 Tax=Haloferax sp. DFSO52 TaxID=3388505 RepID=UPI003A8C312E